MSKFSINFKKVSTHSFKHNDRTEIKKADTVFAQFTDRNICDISAKEAQQNLDNYYDEAMSKIEGRARRAKRENTLIEAVVNVKKNTTLEDLKKLQAYIEKEYVFTGLQIAIHKDEGHFEDDKFIENYHAHMSFFTLNRSNGRQMFRKEHINPDKLRQLQTDGAQILNMDRGRDKRESGVERLEHREHKRAKRAEEKYLAKEKDLKEEIAKLREELKAHHADRKDYAQLEQLNRELQIQIKSKDLTIEDLDKQINIEKQYIEALKSKNEALHEEMVKKNEIIDSTPNTDNVITQVNEEAREILLEEEVEIKRYGVLVIIKFLKEKYFQLKDIIKNLKAENEALRTENLALKEQSNSKLSTKELLVKLGEKNQEFFDTTDSHFSTEHERDTRTDSMDENSEYTPPKAYRTKN